MSTRENENIKCRIYRTLIAGSLNIFTRNLITSKIILVNKGKKTIENKTNGFPQSFVSLKIFYEIKYTLKKKCICIYIYYILLYIIYYIYLVKKEEEEKWN